MMKNDDLVRGKVKLTPLVRPAPQYPLVPDRVKEI